MTGHALRPTAWVLFALSLALACLGLALLVRDWGLAFPRESL